MPSPRSQAAGVASAPPRTVAPAPPSPPSGPCSSSATADLQPGQQPAPSQQSEQSPPAAQQQEQAQESSAPAPPAQPRLGDAAAAAAASDDQPGGPAMELRGSAVLEAEVAAMLMGLPQAAPPRPQAHAAVAPPPPQLPTHHGLPILPDFVRNKDIKKDLPLTCHIIGCGLDLMPQADYYQRYRVCREHLKCRALVVDGMVQRFCQQCGRFHQLHEFDSDKRNCRARLQQHNSRRRKVFAMSQELRRNRYVQQDPNLVQPEAFGPAKQSLAQQWKLPLDGGAAAPLPPLPLPGLQLPLALPAQQQQVQQQAQFGGGTAGDAASFAAAFNAVAASSEVSSQQSPLRPGTKRTFDAMASAPPATHGWRPGAVAGAGPQTSQPPAALATALLQQLQQHLVQQQQQQRQQRQQPVPTAPRVYRPTPDAPASLLLERMAQHNAAAAQAAPAPPALQGHAQAQQLAAVYPQLAAQVGQLLQRAQPGRQGSPQGSTQQHWQQQRPPQQPPRLGGGAPAEGALAQALAAAAGLPPPQAQAPPPTQQPQPPLPQATLQSLLAQAGLLRPEAKPAPTAVKQEPAVPQGAMGLPGGSLPPAAAGLLQALLSAPSQQQPAPLDGPPPAPAQPVAQQAGGAGTLEQLLLTPRAAGQEPAVAQLLLQLLGAAAHQPAR